MKAPDVEEARDLVEEASGLESLNRGDREILQQAARILEDLLPCGNCKNRGWVLEIYPTTGLCTVHHCEDCKKYTSDAAAGEQAVKTLNNLLKEVDIL